MSNLCWLTSLNLPYKKLLMCDQLNHIGLHWLNWLDSHWLLLEYRCLYLTSLMNRILPMVFLQDEWRKIERLDYILRLVILFSLWKGSVYQNQIHRSSSSNGIVFWYPKRLVTFRLIFANIFIFRVPSLNIRGFYSLDILLVEG